MGKQRLEAFSDGVIAIIITVMVLEMKVPQGTDWVALRPLIPVFLSYALSYLFLGILLEQSPSPVQAIRVYVLVVVMWLIPDRRIENVLAAPGHAQD